MIVNASIKGKTFLENAYGKFMVTTDDESSQRYVLYRWSNTKNDYQMLGYFTGRCASVEGDVYNYLEYNITQSKRDEWLNECRYNNIVSSSMDDTETKDCLNETDMSEYQLDDYYFPEGYEIELVEVDNNEQNETGSDAISKDKSHKVYNVVFSKYYGNYGYSIIKLLSFTTKQKSLNYINSVVDAWKIIGHNIDAENDVWKINNSGIKYKIELKESKMY